LRSAFRRRLGLPVESTDAQSRLTTLPVTFLQRTLKAKFVQFEFDNLQLNEKNCPVNKWHFVDRERELDAREKQYLPPTGRQE